MPATDPQAPLSLFWVGGVRVTGRSRLSAVAHHRDVEGGRALADVPSLALITMLAYVLVCALLECRPAARWRC
jgi:hypothetical protein